VTSVRELGVLNPLLVTPEGLVISGHRRLDAARQARLGTVPVVVFTGSDLAALRVLVESNRNRQKSNEQMARERAAHGGGAQRGSAAQVYDEWHCGTSDGSIGSAGVFVLGRSLLHRPSICRLLADTSG
jgi:hypothetical protein